MFFIRTITIAALGETAGIVRDIDKVPCIRLRAIVLLMSSAQTAIEARSSLPSNSFTCRRAVGVNRSCARSATIRCPSGPHAKEEAENKVKTAKIAAQFFMPLMLTSGRRCTKLTNNSRHCNNFAAWYSQIALGRLL